MSARFVPASGNERAHYALPGGGWVKPPAKKKTNVRKVVGPGNATLLNYLSGLFGPIMTDEQLGTNASSQVHAQIDPILAEITRQSQAAGASGAGYIKSLTDSYASSLEPVAGQVEGDYNKSIGESQAEGNALGDFLSSKGADAAAEVAGKLNAAGAPQAAAAQGSDIAGLGGGAAGESRGHSFATNDALIGNKAAAVSYARTLPGLARMEGLGALGSFSNQNASELASKLGDLTSQVPGLISSISDRLRSGRDDTRSARAQLLSAFLGGQLDRATQLKIAKLGLGNDATKNAIDWSSVLGFKTDANGNPVLDANGDLIPTSDTVNASDKAAGKAKGNHQKAVANRDKAELTAAGAVRAMVKNASTQQYDVSSEPVRLRKNAAGQWIYKKQGGGFTTDPSQAETHTVKTPLAKPAWNALLQQAMALAEVQVLGPRYALSPAQVRKIVTDALRAAGFTPPKAKPAGNKRYDHSGRPG